MKVSGNPEKAINLIDNAILLRKQRAIASMDKKAIECAYDKNYIISNEENVLLSKIKEQLRRMSLSYKSQSMQFNFDDRWGGLIDKHGKKAIVNYFIEPVMVLGVPFMSFMIVAILSCILFILTANFAIILLVASVLHIIAFFEDKKNHEKRRKEKIRKIISGDFRVFN